MSDLCRRILNGQLAFNQQIDVRALQIRQTVAPPERDILLAQLESERAQTNARFIEQLRRNQCALPSPTTTAPTTTTTTTPADRCAQILSSRQAFNAQINAQVINILQNAPQPQRDFALAELEVLRARGNAEFDRQLAANQCNTTTTTTTTTPNRCAEIRENRAEFNADIDAQVAAVDSLDPRVRAPVLARLEAERIAGNAEFDRQLAAAGCLFGS